MKDKIIDGLSRVMRESRVLRIVYNDIKTHGTIQSETIGVVKMLFEKYNKFIDVFEREERRKEGCKYYTDHNGVVRIIATGKEE